MLFEELNQKEKDYLGVLLNIILSYEVTNKELVIHKEGDTFGQNTGSYIQIWYRDEILLCTLKCSDKEAFILLDADYIEVLRQLKGLECYPGPVYEEPNTRVYLKHPNDLNLVSDYLFNSLDKIFAV